MAKATNTETEDIKVEESAKAESAPAVVQTYVVESPVKGFCGVGAAGVNFAYGKAEIKKGWVLDWYKNHGYKVTKKD